MSKSSRLGLLRDRDFGRLFAATALGQLGDRIIFLALPLVAIAALRADEFQVGLLAAMTTAGSLLVGLPAGAWVDRMRKRSVMISTDLVRALVLLTIPVTWWAGLLTIWWLYAVPLVHGVLTVFFDVAYVSYLPHLVGRGNLVEGNSKLSTMRSVTSISGPTVAGPLVGLIGAPATLLVSSAGMAMSGLLARPPSSRGELLKQVDGVGAGVAGAGYQLLGDPGEFAPILRRRRMRHAGPQEPPWPHNRPEWKPGPGHRARHNRLGPQPISTRATSAYRPAP